VILGFSRLLEDALWACLSQHTNRGELAEFRHCAERCIEHKRPGWKNAKQWSNTLEACAYPHIGKLDVRVIDTRFFPVDLYGKLPYI
jgi:hypothetical protein